MVGCSYRSMVGCSFVFMILVASSIAFRFLSLDWVCLHCLHEGLLSMITTLLFYQSPSSEYAHSLLLAASTCVLSLSLHVTDLPLFLSCGGILLTRFLLQEKHGKDVLRLTLLVVSVVYRRWKYHRHYFRQVLSDTLLIRICKLVNYGDPVILGLHANSFQM